MWDNLCGFTTAGEAARLRRDEDARACEILGAEPVWLPFAYGEYVGMGVRSEDRVWNAIEPHLREAALVLVPGHPLHHEDHAWLRRLVTQRAPASLKLGFYVEQPYANVAVMGRGYTHRPVLTGLALALRTPHGRDLQRPTLPEADAGLLDGTLEWYAARADRRDRRRKIEAIRAYASQVRWFGRRWLPRIRLYEWGWGGEGIGLPSDRPRARSRRRAVPRCDLGAMVTDAQADPQSNPAGLLATRTEGSALGALEPR